MDTKKDMFTHVKRPSKRLEINSGKKLVETAGYRTSRQQINEIMLAGERLEAYRQNQFDFKDGEPEPDLDPTRGPNFDLADASRLLEETERKIAQAKAEKAEAYAAEAASKAEAAKAKLRQEILDEQNQKKLDL